MVRIDNVLSYEGINKYGVLQGSVLGPILFLFYIHLISDLYLDGLVSLGWIRRKYFKQNAIFI
jgi:mannose/fructose/N-acetylgalactosamine-specific phosphotransferase system component IID